MLHCICVLWFLVSGLHDLFFFIQVLCCFRCLVCEGSHFLSHLLVLRSVITAFCLAMLHASCFLRPPSHLNTLSLSVCVQVFHDIAYKAKDRQDLLAGIDEFLDEVIVLPPGEWDPAIRIEPPKTLPSSDKRLNTHALADTSCDRTHACSSASCARDMCSKRHNQ